MNKLKLLAFIGGMFFGVVAHAFPSGWYKVEGVGGAGAAELWVNIRNPSNNNAVDEAVVKESRFTANGVDRALSTLLGALHTNTWCYFNITEVSNSRDEITSFYCNRDASGI